MAWKFDGKDSESDGTEKPPKCTGYQTTQNCAPIIDSKQWTAQLRWKPLYTPNNVVYFRSFECFLAFCSK